MSAFVHRRRRSVLALTAGAGLAAVLGLAGCSGSTDETLDDKAFATAVASERYAKIVDNGGWPKVPGNVGPKAKGPAIAALRRRLDIEGDPNESVGQGEQWDARLVAAVLPRSRPTPTACCSAGRTARCNRHAAPSIATISDSSASV